MVSRAVNNLNVNDGKNGWAQIDLTNNDALNDIFDNSIEAAGVVQIPVCGAEEAYNNWGNVGKGKSKNHPCDRWGMAWSRTCAETVVYC